MQITALVINGKTYAKYGMNLPAGILFLKMIEQIIPGPGNEQQSEDLLIHIIQLVEKKQFHTVSYLNI